MKKITKVMACFLVMMLLTTTVYAAGAVPEKVINATESVVRILSKYTDGYATGTGFVIKCDKDETLVVTNYHVVEDNPYSISVWVEEDELINAEILAATSQKDICILRLSQQVSLKPVTLSQTSAKQGDAVYAVGFPAAADILSDTEAHTSQAATITDGIVSAKREVTTTQYGTAVEILQISAAINSGNSGGPLFDTDGKVVGVNTYGIADAQGIFGAIDISEIHRFLDESGIAVKSDSKSSILIAIVAGIAIVAIGCIVVFHIKKENSMGRNKKQNGTTLRKFMSEYPDGLGVHDAVALLLPVAIQLRDMHNNGQPHLQVSPDTIMVGTTSWLVAPTEAESDRYASGFAAKEIYSGSEKGALSDIYSFCAVLYYASFGSVPVNALQRGAEDICTNGNPAFAKIINQGMQIQPEDRFETMQNIIIKLSEYNVKPFTPKEVPQVTAATSRQKKRTPLYRILIAVSVIAIVIVVGYMGSYLAAFSFAQKGDYSSAEKYLIAPAITKLHDKYFPAYVEAGVLMEHRQYLESRELYASISGYLDSDTLALEADYRYAAQLADANDFDNSIRKYKSLASENYKDSEEKAREVKYRKGLYILYEEENYLKAYNYLSSSVCDDMNNISEIRNDLKELLYNEAVNFYREGKLDQADDRFLEGYKDSDKYQLLIEVQKSYYGRFGLGDPETDVKKLIDFFYFEDTADVLLSKQAIAEAFLRGNWQSTTGGKYFKMNDDGHISYNLPWFNYGDYYKIQNGELVCYPEDDESATKTLFTIVALTPNQIQVYCHKDGSAYILNRQ